MLYQTIPVYKLCVYAIEAKLKHKANLFAQFIPAKKLVLDHNNRLSGRHYLCNGS